MMNEHAWPDRHIEELEASSEDQKIPLCRCWKSKKFPYCDGSHRAHNESTGDCVGPVVITIKAKL